MFKPNTMRPGFIRHLIEDAVLAFGNPLLDDGNEGSGFIISLHRHSCLNPWVRISHCDFVEPEVIDMLDDDDCVSLVVSGLNPDRISYRTMRGRPPICAYYARASEHYVEAHLSRWAAMLATKVAVQNAPSLSYNRTTHLWELTHQGSTRTLGA